MEEKMKIKKPFQLLSIPLLMLAASCGGDSSSNDSQVVENGITELIGEVESAVNGASEMYDGESSKKLVNKIFQKSLQPKTAFSAKWSTASGSGLYNPKIEGDSIPEISVQDYVEIMLDETAVSEGDDPSSVSPFSRITNDLQIFCAIGVGMTLSGQTVDSSGYVAAGSYTFDFSPTIKTAMTTTCGIDTSSIPDNQTLNITVETGTTYERKFSFDLFNQEYWVTNNASVLRIASSENADQGYSRSYIEINKSTNVTRAQYVWTTSQEQGEGGVELYRIYFDENSDEAMVMGYRGSVGGMSDVDTATRFIFAGKPENGADISVGFVIGRGDNTTYKACVNSETLAMGTDDALCTADADSLAGAEISAISTIVSNFYTTYAATADAGDWGIEELSESDVVPFTDESDLVTEDFAP
jgi:hypothetical protein